VPPPLNQILIIPYLLLISSRFFVIKGIIIGYLKEL